MCYLDFFFLFRFCKSPEKFPRSSITLHAQPLSYLPKLPLKLKLFEFEGFFNWQQPEHFESRVHDMNYKSSCELMRFHEFKRRKPKNFYCRLSQRKWLSQFGSMGWCKVLMGHIRTIRISYMECWSNKKILKRPTQQSQRLERKKRYDKKLMVTFNSLILPLSCTLLHNIRMVYPAYLLIAQIKSCSKLTNCFNAVMCRQPPNMAGRLSTMLWRWSKWWFGSP